MNRLREISPEALRAILATRFVRGGRIIGEALDCLGVTLHMLWLRGFAFPDPWPEILGQMAISGSATGFPPGWHRMPDGELARDDDVLLLFAPEPWAGFVYRGHVYSSSIGVGSAYAVPAARMRRPPDEVWRHG